MKFSEGKQVYKLSESNCIGVGLRWSKDQVNGDLIARVGEVFFDEQGNEEFLELLTGVGGSEFSTIELKHTWLKFGTFDLWRVGEAIAEAFLVDNCSCNFPWPMSRDSRRQTASLPGADLVGLKKDKASYRFIFGEIKTSSQERYPPSVMLGSKGLQKQVEYLAVNPKIRRDLVRYLGNHARSATWKGQYQLALKRYLTNSEDYQLIGVLVRGVLPNPRDLEKCVRELGTKSSIKTNIKLYGLYFLDDGLLEIKDSLISRQSIPSTNS